MEEVLDALRKIIARWVKTVVPLTADYMAGDTTVTVHTTRRFSTGDEIAFRVGGQYEKPANFRVKSIIDMNTIELNQPLTHNWTVASGAVVCKMIHGNMVQGIYLGDPENIEEFPAITVNGISEESEWITIDSVKDTFNVEIGIFVLDSTMETGYRFLLRLTKLVKYALMNNLFPLVNDYETTAVTADVVSGDANVTVADSSIFCPGDVVLFEDQYKTIETRVLSVVDDHTLEVFGHEPLEFSASDNPVAIKFHRFIFNSYPKSVNYGKIHKGSLLKAAVIEWFGWEEIVGPTNGGGWSDPQLR